MLPLQDLIDKAQSIVNNATKDLGIIEFGQRVDLLMDNITDDETGKFDRKHWEILRDTLKWEDLT